MDDPQFGAVLSAVGRLGMVVQLVAVLEDERMMDLIAAVVAGHGRLLGKPTHCDTRNGWFKCRFGSHPGWRTTDRRQALSIRIHSLEGQAIPTFPLALSDQGRWLERHRSALTRDDHERLPRRHCVGTSPPGRSRCDSTGFGFPSAAERW